MSGITSWWEWRWGNGDLERLWGENRKEENKEKKRTAVDATVIHCDTCIRHLLSAELWLLNTSYLFATMNRDISIGFTLLASFSWSLVAEVAASLITLAAPASVDCNSRSRKSTTLPINLIHFNNDARQFCGFERSQQITTEEVLRLRTVSGTSSSFGSDISPPDGVCGGRCQTKISTWGLQY